MRTISTGGRPREAPPKVRCFKVDKVDSVTRDDQAGKVLVIEAKDKKAEWLRVRFEITEAQARQIMRDLTQPKE